MKQQAFAAFKKQPQSFGGTLLKGHAKGKRPIDTKKPLHLVLRSDHPLSLRSPTTFGDVNLIVKNAVEKYGFTVYRFANVGNHLHVLLRVTNRHLWARFIREITGRIAQLIRTRSGRTEPVWAHKPFTRVVQSWRKDFQNVRGYIFLNELEGGCVITHVEKRILRRLRAFWCGDGPPLAHS